METGFSATEVANWVSGRVVNSDALGGALARVRVERLSALGVSKSSDLAFFFSKEYERELLSASPGILVTGEAFVRPLEGAGLSLWNSSAVIACTDPYLAMAKLSERFAELASTVGPPRQFKETVIHSSATVHPSAQLAKGVQVGAHCVIEAGASIGSGTILYPGCYVGPSVQIGESGVLFAGVKVYEFVKIGDRVRLHAGCVLGSDGFGYAPIREKGRVVGHQKIYHLGRVIVGNDVEIGANSCIDRGTLADTILGDLVKLDNQVHVGHNARLGKGTIVCGGVCFAGSSSTGEFAYIGGMVGITNQVHVGDRASVCALSLVTKDVPPDGVVAGNPQRNHKEHFKIHAQLNRQLAERKKGKSHE